MNLVALRFYPSGGPPTLGRAMASPADLERVGRASLTELGDIRIDDVLSFIDRGIEKMPSYMDLYRRCDHSVAPPFLQRGGARHVHSRPLRLGLTHARDRGL